MNLKVEKLLMSALLVLNSISNAQVGVGTTTPSSKLEVVGSGTTAATTALKVGNASGTILSVRNDGLVEISSTTQGFLPPRMTTVKRNAISNPPDGLIIFNTRINALEICIAGAWYQLSTNLSTASNITA